MGKHLWTLAPLVTACVLWASSVVPLTFTELSKRAHRVVIGRIERITAHDDAQTGRILSRIEVAPSRSLAGGSLLPVSFEMTGGTVGDRRQWISGFPQLKPGDRVVLFLAEDTSTPLGPTIGLWQGVFFVENDQTITDHRRRPIAGIRGEEVVLSDAAQPARMTIDSFAE